MVHRRLGILLAAVVGMGFAQSGSDSLLGDKLRRAGEIARQASSPAVEEQVRSVGSVVLQTIVALGVVIGLIVLLVYLLRRLSQTGKIAGLASSGIEILESAPIAPGQRIAIVRVYEQKLIVALNNQGM